MWRAVKPSVREPGSAVWPLRTSRSWTARPVVNWTVPTPQLPAGASLLVRTVNVDLLMLLAALVGFCIPLIVSVTAVLFPTAQAPPLFASVMVTVGAAPTAAAEQFVNPAPSTIVGEAGGTKFRCVATVFGNVTVIVLPAASEPDPPVVKFDRPVRRRSCLHRGA